MSTTVKTLLAIQLITIVSAMSNIRAFEGPLAPNGRPTMVVERIITSNPDAFGFNGIGRSPFDPTPSDDLRNPFQFRDPAANQALLRPSRSQRSREEAPPSDTGLLMAAPVFSTIPRSQRYEAPNYSGQGFPLPVQGFQIIPDTPGFPSIQGSLIPMDQAGSVFPLDVPSFSTIPGSKRFRDQAGPAFPLDATSFQSTPGFSSIPGSLISKDQAGLGFPQDAPSFQSMPGSRNKEPRSGSVFEADAPGLTQDLSNGPFRKNLPNELPIMNPDELTSAQSPMFNMPPLGMNNDMQDIVDFMVKAMNKNAPLGTKARVSKNLNPGNGGPNYLNDETLGFPPTKKMKGHSKKDFPSKHGFSEMDDNNMPDLTSFENMGGMEGNKEFGDPQSDEIIQLALYMHNDLRAKHRSPPLEYNDKIAQVAQEYAEKLAKRGMLQHSSQDEYGENLYMAGSSMPFSAEDVVKKGIQSWYDENEHYQAYGNAQPTPATGTVAHFTALVWKSTKQFGIGVAKSGQNYVLVANYYPPGNMMGDYADNVLSPIDD